MRQAGGVLPCCVRDVLKCSDCFLGKTVVQRGRIRTVESEYGVRLSRSPAIRDLSLGKTALLDDGRHEPLFAFATPRAAFAEVARLDPTRVEFDAKPPPIGRGSPRGSFDSLILHLLALLVIIGWPSQIPADIPAPIPVELVIEQPPPPPPAEPKPRANPAQGRHASDDFAEVAAPKPDKGAGDAAAANAGEPQPSATQAQSPLAPPSPAAPEPDRPKEETLAEPQPSTAETRVAAVTPPPLPPKPAAPRTQAVLRTPKPLGSEWPLPLETDHPQAPVHAARLVGPAAIRDEYCARLLSLTLRNIGLLPLSAIGARHGQTSVQFRVTGDGTLNSVKVVQSSGYPDIDVRVAQMVLAVGRFPPLPQWIRGEWMDFTFDLRFPHPSQR
jgi:protein TonB